MVGKRENRRPVLGGGEEGGLALGDGGGKSARISTGRWRRKKREEGNITGR